MGIALYKIAKKSGRTENRPLMGGVNLERGRKISDTWNL